MGRLKFMTCPRTRSALHIYLLLLAVLLHAIYLFSRLVHDLEGLTLSFQPCKPLLI